LTCSDGRGSSEGGKAAERDGWEGDLLGEEVMDTEGEPADDEGDEESSDDRIGHIPMSCLGVRHC
jgi:hypothetical protein